MTVPTSTTVVFRRYINKSNQTSVQAVEVKEMNIHALQVLWKQPDVKLGDFVVKANHMYFKLDAITFNARYRKPR